MQSVAAAAKAFRKIAKFWGRFSDLPPPLFRPPEGLQQRGPMSGEDINFLAEIIKQSSPKRSICTAGRSR
jgi:hypothetical protein